MEAIPSGSIAGLEEYVHWGKTFVERMVRRITSFLFIWFC
jgi:hypothetical protein